VSGRRASQKMHRLSPVSVIVVKREINVLILAGLGIFWADLFGGFNEGGGEAHIGLLSLLQLLS
jgi:hypothetical protein